MFLERLWIGLPITVGLVLLATQALASEADLLRNCSQDGPSEVRLAVAKQSLASIVQKLGQLKSDIGRELAIQSGPAPVNSSEVRAEKGRDKAQLDRVIDQYAAALNSGNLPKTQTLRNRVRSARIAYERTQSNISSPGRTVASLDPTFDQSRQSSAERLKKLTALGEHYEALLGKAKNCVNVASGIAVYADPTALKVPEGFSTYQLGSRGVAHNGGAVGTPDPQLPDLSGVTSASFGDSLKAK